MSERGSWYADLGSLTDLDVIDWGERVHEVADALPSLLAIAEAAENLLDDVDEAQAEDLRLHDLEHKIGAIFLGCGGGYNHEADLRLALRGTL